jgi:hypothetical protein
MVIFGKPFLFGQLTRALELLQGFLVVAVLLESRSVAKLCCIRFIV